MMNFVIVRCKNFRFDLSCKIFNRLLPSMLRHYKNKRPPPTPGQLFYTPISIWFSQLNHPFRR